MDLGLAKTIGVSTVGIGLAIAFVFLCSKRASSSVGSTYFADGGTLKSLRPEAGILVDHRASASVRCNQYRAGC